jgi:hypothetical protein
MIGTGFIEISEEIKGREHGRRKGGGEKNRRKLVCSELQKLRLNI